MISNQILKETISGMKEVTGIDLCILDLSGRIVVTTMEFQESLTEHATEFAESMAESQVIDGFQYFKIFDEQRLEYILLVNGMSENAYTIGKLAVMQIQNLLTAYKERLDKENFVKNLLRDNLLLVDIYNRSKKLHIEVEQRRVAFLIQAEYEKDQNLLEAMKEVERIGFDTIEKNEKELLKYIIDGLKDLSRVRLYADNENINDRLGILVFTIDGMSYEEVGEKLSEVRGIGVRQGGFCSHPYTRRVLGIADNELQNYISKNGVPGLVRVSLGIYNTKKEANIFLETIEYLCRRYAK